VFQYDAQIPTSVQWNSEMQVTLPWASALTAAYVGNHGYNRLGAFQGGQTVNLNAVDFGAAYLPQNQDPTKGPGAFPGINAVTTNLLRPYRGLGIVAQQTTEFWDTYHSVQLSLNRRYRDGFAFGVNYTRGLSFKGNTGLQKRLVHAADGTITVRADQAEYEALNENLDVRPNIFKANALWDLPKAPGTDAGAGRALGWILNDWQVSGVLTMGSGTAYDLNYNYSALGGAPGNGSTNLVLTGSPDYAARILYTGDPGSGCSSDQYRQFNAATVTGPQPNSTGLESGRNLLRGCMDKTVDMAFAKNVRLGGQRSLQFRADVFNLFDTYVINARNTTVNYTSPSNLTVANSETLPDGSVDPNRLTPRTAGFGAATGAANRGVEAGLGNNYNRVLMLQVRFQF